MSICIEPITEQRLRHVLAHLSTEDAAELGAAGLADTSYEAFSFGWHNSVECGCIEFDGEPVAVFGATPSQQNAGVAIVWMVATARFQERPQAMARLSRKVVASWRARFRLLTNLVHADHGRAIDWLRWLGFSIGTAPAGPRGAFYAFFMGGRGV